MRLLDRKRSDAMAGNSVVLTLERDLITFEECFDDRHGFREPLDPGGPPIKREPSLFVFGSDRPSTQAELKTSFSQEVSSRGFASEHYGVPEIVIKDIRADAKVSGRFCRADNRRDRCEKVGEVIGYGKAAVAECFDLAGLFLPLGSRMCRPHVYSKPEWPHVRLAPTLVGRVPRWHVAGSRLTAIIKGQFNTEHGVPIQRSLDEPIRLRQ
jgi:hypothetical protein